MSGELTEQFLRFVLQPGAFGLTGKIFSDDCSPSKLVYPLLFLISDPAWMIEILQILPTLLVSGKGISNSQS